MTRLRLGSFAIVLLGINSLAEAQLKNDQHDDSRYLVFSVNQLHEETDGTFPADAGDVSPTSMMHDYLMARVQEAMDQRQTRYEQLATPEELVTYQQRMRQFFLDALGPLPERTPLNANVVATQECDGYRIERIIFESQPRHYVTGILYLPEQEPPYPAVLVPCGHSRNGKASEAYQKICILLARNGMASFCYDPIDQGERFQLLDDQGKPLEGGTTAHCLVGVGSTLLGRNTATFRVWDGMRAIDYLVSREEIDPQKIGCTGNSGGGTLTSYLMALDERIVCAAPSCYLCGFRRLCETIGPQDAEQNIYGQIAFGLDHADYILIRAPKPTLMCTATHDFFDIDGAWACFRQAKRFYTRLGHAERVSLIEADAEHGFSPHLRVGAARWMRRWLLDSDGAITEPELPVASDQQLQCTPEGQVMLLAGARSVYDLNVELEQKLAQIRQVIWQQNDKQAALTQVRQVTGIQDLADIPPCECTTVTSVPWEEAELRKLILRPQPEIVLPALAFIPPARSGDAYLYVHGEGKHVDADPGGPMEALVRQGHVVLAVDLRGIGETAGKESDRGGISRYIGPQWKNFYLAYLLGTSYLAMRAEDILTSARFLADYEAAATPHRVHLVGVGRAGPPALHAATLEPELFTTVSLRTSLASWSQLLRDPLATQHFENVVHGALQSYDLPDLVSLLPQEHATVTP